jgi:hypothetical protein
LDVGKVTPEMRAESYGVKRGVVEQLDTISTISTGRKRVGKERAGVRCGKRAYMEDRAREGLEVNHPVGQLVLAKQKNELVPSEKAPVAKVGVWEGGGKREEELPTATRAGRRASNRIVAGKNTEGLGLRRDDGGPSEVEDGWAKKCRPEQDQRNPPEDGDVAKEEGGEQEPKPKGDGTQTERNSLPRGGSKVRGNKEKQEKGRTHKGP